MCARAKGFSELESVSRARPESVGRERRLRYFERIEMREEFLMVPNTLAEEPADLCTKSWLGEDVAISSEFVAVGPSQRPVWVPCLNTAVTAILYVT